MKKNNILLILTSCFLHLFFSWAASPLGQIHTNHFDLTYSVDQEAFAQELAKQIESLHLKVLRDLGTTPLDKTRIVVVTNLAEMRRAAPSPSFIPSWAAGVSFPKKRLILLRTNSGTKTISNLTNLFLHEWAHIALEHAVGFSYLPRWFKEGFAMMQSGEWSTRRFQTLTWSVISGKLLSLADLETRFPANAHDSEVAYAQSIDFVSFLLSKHTSERFHQLIRLLRQGWSFELALEEAYETGLRLLEQDWHDDLKSRFTWFSLITTTTFLWFSIALIMIAAYLRKRREKARSLERLDKEEDFEWPPPSSLH